MKNQTVYSRTAKRQRCTTLAFSVLVAFCCVWDCFVGTGSGSLCQAQQGNQSAGTGFAINANGYFCTCYHVVSETTSITAILHTAEGRKASYRAEIITVDPSNDLAIIKINRSDLAPIPVFTDKVQIGQETLVIGFPLLIPLGQSAKMTRGLVSGFVNDIIQIDASINPGNSGCPVVNQFGQCFGIASAKMSGPRVSNIGFCIPTAALVRLLDENGISYLKVNRESNSGLESMSPAKVFEKVNGSLALILANKRPGAGGIMIRPSDRSTNPNPPHSANGPNGRPAEGSGVDQPGSVHPDASSSPLRPHSGTEGSQGADPGIVSSSRPAPSPVDLSQYSDGIILYQGKIAVPPAMVRTTTLAPGQVWLAPNKYIETLKPAAESALEMGNQEETSLDPDSDAVKRAKEKLLSECEAEVRAATTPIKKSQLTRKFYSQAQEEKKSFKKFVLFCVARDMAIESGDANTARRIVQEMVSVWDLDPFPANRSSFMSVGRNVRTASQWEHLGFWAVELSQMAIERDETKLAALLNKIFSVAVKKSGSKDLESAAAGKIEQLEFLIKASDQAAKIKELGAEKADNPEVCTSLGLYRCFANNNYVDGLPLLLKSGDDSIRQAAELEFSGLKKTSQRLKAANLWWEISLQADSLYKEPIQARAVYHYSKIIGTEGAKTLDEAQRRQITRRMSPNRSLIQKYAQSMEESEKKIILKKASGSSQNGTESQLAEENSSDNQIYRYIKEQFRLERTKKSPMAGNVSSGNAYTSVLKEGGLMVGLEVSFNSSNGVSSLTPLFRDKAGGEEIRGATIGYPGQTVGKIAGLPGYAVCGFQIVGSTGIEGLGGIQVLFARIGDRSLAHDDMYRTSFVGRGQPDQTSVFTSNGGFIVGIQGQMSDPGIRQLLALGVVIVPPAPDEEQGTKLGAGD